MTTTTNPTFKEKRIELVNKKKNLQAEIVELQKRLRWLQDESFITQGGIDWIDNEMKEWDCEDEQWW